MKFGRLLFWLAWPGLFIYFYRSHRSRVLIIQDNKALLVKGWWNVWFSDIRWDLPGGGFSRREQPVAGALRELSEELNMHLKPEDLQLLGENQIHERGLSYHAHYFVYKAPTNLTFTAHKPEIAETSWINLDQLPAVAHKPEVDQALQLLAQQ